MSMNEKLLKVMNASSIETWDVLSLMFGDPQLFKKCTRQGPITMNCFKCPIGKKECLRMHDGRKISKKECSETIEAYVNDKPFLLPIPDELHKKLLDLGFQKGEEYINSLEEKRSCYVMRLKNTWLTLCPLISGWLVIIDSPGISFEKTLEDLSSLDGFFKNAKARCMETTERDIEWARDEEYKRRIPIALKKGNEFLEGIEAFKRIWDESKIGENI